MDGSLPLYDTADLLALGLDRPDRRPDAGFSRPRRGIYTPEQAWAEASAEQQYRTKVLAASRTIAPGAIFSNESAANLLGLPVLGEWPPDVHIVTERRSGGRSQLDIVRHCVGLEGVEPWTIDDVLVTSPARTAFDIALTRSFRAAVVTMDAALRLYPDSAAELSGLVSWYGRRRGYQRLDRAHSFASGLSGSPGESLSRIEIDELGFIRPVLQFEVVTDGRSEFVDFGFPDVRGAGEYDGEVKYRLDRYRMGGTVEDVVIREKNRENRIRVPLPRFARWDTRDLRAGRLERILLAVGIPKRNF